MYIYHMVYDKKHFRICRWI